METRAINPQALPTNAAPFLSKLLGTCFVARTNFLGDGNFSQQTNRGVPRLPVLFEVMSERPQKNKVLKMDGLRENSDVVEYLLQNLHKGDMKLALLFKLKKDNVKQVERGDITVLKSCLKNVWEGAILRDDTYEVISKNLLYELVEKIEQTLKKEKEPASESMEMQTHDNLITPIEKCSGDTAHTTNYLSTSKPIFCNKSTQYEHLNGYSECCTSNDRKETGQNFSKCVGIEISEPFKREPVAFADSFKNAFSKEIPNDQNDKSLNNDAHETRSLTPLLVEESLIPKRKKDLQKLEGTPWQTSKLVPGSDHLDEAEVDSDKCGLVELSEEDGLLIRSLLVDEKAYKQSTRIERSALHSLEADTTSNVYGYNTTEQNPDNHYLIGSGANSNFMMLNTSNVRVRKPSKIPIPIEQSMCFQRLLGKYCHAQKFATALKDRSGITYRKIPRDGGDGFRFIRELKAIRRESSRENSGVVEKDDQRQLQKSQAKHKTKLPVSTRMRNEFKKHIRYTIVKSLEKRQTATQGPRNVSDIDKKDKVLNSDRLNIMMKTKPNLISRKLKENEIYDQKQRDLVKLIAHGLEQEIYSNLKKDAI